MSKHVAISDDDVNALMAGAGYNKEYERQKKQFYGDLLNYIKDVLKDDRPIDVILLDRDTFQSHLQRFFLSKRVEEVTIDPKTGKKTKTGALIHPKQGYAKQIRTKLVQMFKTNHGVDITSPTLFPTNALWWKHYNVLLKSLGRADVEHKPELHHEFNEQMMTLASNCLEALEARGGDPGQLEELVAKIPAELRDKAHYVVLWTVVFLLGLFEVRRGREGYAFMKRNQFQIVTDEITGIQQWRRAFGEVTKNHRTDAEDITLGGVIPFVPFTSTFNPGEFIKSFLNLQPPPDAEGHCGRLLLTPRRPCIKFDLWNPQGVSAYNHKQPVGVNTVANAISNLCAAIEVDHRTNHCVRVSAIKSLQRGGFYCGQITNLSGHKDSRSIGKSYAVSVDPLDKLDMASSMIQGGSYLKGHVVPKLSTEIMKRRAAPNLSFNTPEQIMDSLVSSSGRLDSRQETSTPKETTSSAKSKPSAPLTDLELQIKNLERNSDELSDYEKRKLQNLKERQELYEKLDMTKAKNDCRINENQLTTKTPNVKTPTLPSRPKSDLNLRPKSVINYDEVFNDSFEECWFCQSFGNGSSCDYKEDENVMKAIEVPSHDAFSTPIVLKDLDTEDKSTTPEDDVKADFDLGINSGESLIEKDLQPKSLRKELSAILEQKKELEALFKQDPQLKGKNWKKSPEFKSLQSQYYSLVDEVIQYPQKYSQSDLQLANKIKTDLSKKQNSNESKEAREKAGERKRKSTDSEDRPTKSEKTVNNNFAPLDIVWAKSRGFPWYPSVIIDPSNSPCGYFKDGSLIPKPSKEVLDLRLKMKGPHYLVMYFDSRKSWQWIPEDKLEYLGIDVVVDNKMLNSSNKSNERKMIKKAFDEAIPEIYTENSSPDTELGDLIEIDEIIDNTKVFGKNCVENGPTDVQKIIKKVTNPASDSFQEPVASRTSNVFQNLSPNIPSKRNKEQSDQHQYQKLLNNVKVNQNKENFSHATKNLNQNPNNLDGISALCKKRTEDLNQVVNTQNQSQEKLDQSVNFHHPTNENFNQIARQENQIANLNYQHQDNRPSHSFGMLPPSHSFGMLPQNPSMDSQFNQFKEFREFQEFTAWKQFLSFQQMHQLTSKSGNVSVVNSMTINQNINNAKN